jgi:uncharacterized protein YyaL (SSP411 family)
MANRLADESSPYLLQHAGNPVDWYPWGNEAFERARRDDKPIFLSIGYSTCHWCHVMERESFEDERIAAVLNREFVSIKVDREERPDVDRVYMTFVQTTTGSGGWPMSVWLTPELKPFFGGTYFPPSARWGRPGFVEILEEIGRAWKTERTRVLQSAEALTARLRDLAATGRADAQSGDARPGPIADPEALAHGVGEFRRAFDRRNGGFGGAPKFPRPSELLFLLREYARVHDESARDMTLATLRAMADGGMRDHLGGGFHRYSVDAEWRVPHFEKMLYDQAQLTLAFLEAAQASGDGFYAEVAEDTLQYVRRDLTDPEGGFYSAEDADSVPPERAEEPGAHKQEGAFYVWTDAEIAALLGDDADVARARFGIEAGGNAPADPHGEFTGRNLLYNARSVADVARLTGRTPEQVVEALPRIRRALLERRGGRPRPPLDDKVLTGWNGLMIAAFARAARTQPASENAAENLAVAQRAARFIRATLWSESGERLLRRYRRGRADIDAYAEDYAFLVWGLLELFQADGDPAWLSWALALQKRQDELFWDASQGGWFSTTGRDPSVLIRIREDYDGAEPSATSVSALNLITFAHLTAGGDFTVRLEGTLARFGEGLGGAARVVPLLMCALSTYHANRQELVIVGPCDRDDTRALSSAAARVYQPFAVVVPLEPGERQRQVAAVAPFVAPLTMRDGRATAYLCEGFTCRQPVSSGSALHDVLTNAGVISAGPPQGAS